MFLLGVLTLTGDGLGMLPFADLVHQEKSVVASQKFWVIGHSDGFGDNQIV